MKYLKKIFYSKFYRKSEKIQISEIIDFLNSIKTTKGRNNKKEIIKSFYKKNSNQIEILYNIIEIINKNLSQNQEINSDSIITSELVENSYIESLKALNREILHFDKFMQKLKLIKNEKGTNSSEKKFFYLTDLFSYNLREIDVKFIKDIILSNISIGAASKTFLDSIKELIRNDFGIFSENEIKNFERIFNKKFEEGDIELFMGVAPMLPKNFLSFEEFNLEIGKMKKNGEEEILVEEKFDGERIQIHYDKNKGVVFFSRNLENVTKKFDSLVGDLEQYFEDNLIENIILDGEVVGYDYKNEKILDFSFLQSLKNENNYFEGQSEKLKLCIFDCMYLNSKNILQKNILERKNILKSSLKIPNEIIQPIIFTKLSLNQNEIEKNLYNLFKTAKKNNNEGLLIKNISQNSFYYPDKRKNWYKLKYFYKKENDTLDLIVIGGYYGKVK